jgi:hypothetical protein
VHFAPAMCADAPGAPSPPRWAGAASGRARGPRGQSGGLGVPERSGRAAAGHWLAGVSLSHAACRAAERPARDRRAHCGRWRTPRSSSAYCAWSRRAQLRWATPVQGRRAAPSGRETPPVPPPPRARLHHREPQEAEEAAQPGLPPPRPSRLLPALPRRTRGLGTGTPSSEHRCPGPAPPACPLAESSGGSRPAWCWRQP